MVVEEGLGKEGQGSRRWGSLPLVRGVVRLRVAVVVVVVVLEEEEEDGCLFRCQGVGA